MILAEGWLEFAGLWAEYLDLSFSIAQNELLQARKISKYCYLLVVWRVFKAEDMFYSSIEQIYHS